MAIEPPPPDSLKALWQSQRAETAPIAIDELRGYASKLQSAVLRRNMIEYAAAAFVVAIMGWGAIVSPFWIMKLAQAAGALGAGVVCWQLNRRGSARHMPPDGTQSLLDFYRTELVRQRDALRSVGLWYIGPFVPSLILMGVGRWFQAHNPHRTLGTDHLIIMLGGVVLVLVMAVVWLVNQLAAARLQKQIDGLAP